MININSEMLVSSLFVLGFDSIDGMLFTYTLGKLSLDNQKLKLFNVFLSKSSSLLPALFYKNGRSLFSYKEKNFSIS